MVELLRHGLGFEGAADTGQLELLLEIADSSITYRSRYLTSLQADLVLDLLLVDEANPRSIAFQLARAAGARGPVAGQPDADPAAGRGAAGALAADRSATGGGPAS